MKAYGISASEVRKIIHEMGYLTRQGSAGGIAVFDGPGKMACPHIYSDCLEAVLRRHPNATIETAIVTYYGLSDFMELKDELLQEALERFPCTVASHKNTS